MRAQYLIRELPNRDREREEKRMMILYDYRGSGNGYKARLLLALLGVPYELRELDIIAGATRTPTWPTRRVPHSSYFRKCASG
jgi:Glutathione S-transferase, N-terminal domain